MARAVLSAVAVVVAVFTPRVPLPGLVPTRGANLGLVVAACSGPDGDCDGDGVLFRCLSGQQQHPERRRKGTPGSGPVGSRRVGRANSRSTTKDHRLAHQQRLLAAYVDRTELGLGRDDI